MSPEEILNNQTMIKLMQKEADKHRWHADRLDADALVQCFHLEEDGKIAIECSFGWGDWECKFCGQHLCFTKYSQVSSVFDSVTGLFDEVQYKMLNRKLDNCFPRTNFDTLTGEYSDV